MGELVNNVYCVLTIACVIGICVGESDSSLKYPSYDLNTSIPYTLLARLSLNQSSEDRIIFEHDSGEEEHVAKSEVEESDHSPDIPLDLIRRLNDIENTSELKDIIEGYGKQELGNRFGGPDADDDEDAVDRKAAVMPKQAHCKPELVTIKLHDLHDKSMVYYPSCTRVERCGGCCSHELLSCQPTETEMLTFQVIETKYEGGSKFNYKGKKYISVEQHTKCKCDCKIKEEHCNSLQDYNKSQCGCVCKNVDEEDKCRTENDTKLWDPKDCSCVCRYTKECSTGFYFDQKSCNCSPVPTIRRRNSDSSTESRRRWGDNNWYNYKLNPRPVTPLKKVTSTDDVL